MSGNHRPVEKTLCALNYTCTDLLKVLLDKNWYDKDCIKCVLQYLNTRPQSAITYNNVECGTLYDENVTPNILS